MQFLDLSNTYCYEKLWEGTTCLFHSYGKLCVLGSWNFGATIFISMNIDFLYMGVSRFKTWVLNHVFEVQGVVPPASFESLRNLWLICSFFMFWNKVKFFCNLGNVLLCSFFMDFKMFLIALFRILKKGYIETNKDLYMPNVYRGMGLCLFVCCCFLIY